METLPWGNDVPGVNNQVLEFTGLRRKIDELKSDFPQCENENRVSDLILEASATERVECVLISCPIMPNTLILVLTALLFDVHS